MNFSQLLETNADPKNCCVRTDDAFYPTIQGAVFRLSIAFMLIFSCFSIIYNILLSVTLWKTSIIQSHAKILLTNLSLSALIFSVAQISSNILLIRSMANMPNFSITYRDCAFESVAKTVSGYSLSLSTMFVAWERGVATRKFRSYEHNQKFCSFLCVIAAWLCPAITSTWGVWKSPILDRLPICQQYLTFSSGLVGAYVMFDFSLGLLTLAIFLGVSWFSRRKLAFFVYNQAQLSLSERFQLRNNIEITVTLLPSVLLHVLAYAVLDIVVLYFAREHEITHMITGLSVLLTHYCNALVSFYTLLHPILMFYRNPRLRGLLMSLILRKSVTYPDSKIYPQATGIPLTIPPTIVFESQRTNDVEQIDLKILIEDNQTERSSSNPNSSK